MKVSTIDGIVTRTIVTTYTDAPKEYESAEDLWIALEDFGIECALDIDEDLIMVEEDYFNSLLSLGVISRILRNHLIVQGTDELIIK